MIMTHNMVCFDRCWWFKKRVEGSEEQVYGSSPLEWLMRCVCLGKCLFADINNMLSVFYFHLLSRFIYRGKIYVMRQYEKSKKRQE